MEHAYACLLCDEKIKSKDNEKNTMSLIKKHLKSTSHKLKYLVSITHNSNAMLTSYATSIHVIAKRSRNSNFFFIGYVLPRCYKKKTEK